MEDNGSESLSEFIRLNSETILSEWEKFARTCLPATREMEQTTLRDHAKEILEAIARDIEVAQTSEEELAKSQGERPAGELDSAGSEHAAGRVGWGFSLGQLASELRALRACVVRRWLEDGGSTQALTRFHEAMDQLLAASLIRYDLEFSRSRDMFLAILGHDLRSPLNSVMMAGAYILRREGRLTQEELTETATGIAASSQRMKHLIQNLMEFAQLRMGEVVRLTRAPVDLKTIAEAIIREVSSDGAVLKLEVHGDVTGEWDNGRLQQVLSNLIGNAIKHGSTTKPVTIVLTGSAEEVVLSVHNFGIAIPPHQIKFIFFPFRSGESAETKGQSVGLGLYIAEEIVRAHRGSISVSSGDAEGTTFTVRLPKRVSEVSVASVLSLMVPSEEGSR